MLIESKIPLGEQVATADQRVVAHNVPWSHYQAQVALRGEAAVPRFSYLEGALEIMTPSKDHERIKSYLGMLVEAYALERGIDLSPYGAWTLEKAPHAAAVEPDECYILGDDQSKEVPDLAIEVVWTSGGIDKLEAYRRLGVREVWFWRDEAIEAFVLADGAYQRIKMSHLFPDLEPSSLCLYLDEPTALRAVRAYRKTLAPC